MKIAREIAEAVYEEHWYSDDGTGRVGIDITSSELESIVAEKLEPAAKVIRDIWSGECEICGPGGVVYGEEDRKPCRCPDCQAVCDAVAMFGD